MENKKDQRKRRLLCRLRQQEFFVGAEFLLTLVLTAALIKGNLCLAGILTGTLMLCLALRAAIDGYLRRERERLKKIDGLFLTGEEFPRWFPVNEEDFEKKVRCLEQILEEGGDRQMSQEFLLVQAKMRALQNQINPHFLYNTLDTIRSYALMEDCSEVAEMTEALATMFRYNISKPGDMGSLREELDNVNNYFLIQKYRFGDKFHLSLEIDEEDERLKECRLPRLSIQPLVENAIHHGLENKSGSGIVRIEIERISERLQIRVSDNGVGMPREELLKLREKLEQGIRFEIEPGKKRSSGIAIVNLNQRLKLAFGEEYGVTVSSIEQVGTFFTIQIPYMLYTQEEKE